jgi:hypothetical protein
MRRPLRTGFGISRSPSRLGTETSILSVDFNDLHLYLITFPQFVANVRYSMVSNFGYVEKSLSIP